MQAKPVFCFSSFYRSHETVPPPLKQFKARDGQTLSYRFYDSPNEDRIIILLHGSSAHGEYLHPLAERLRGIGQVYVPNLRGHHASGDVRGDCSYIGQLEDDFADLLTQENANDKDIYVVGHSSGGGLAIRLGGGSYGHRIRGFVLLSPAIPTAPTMRGGTAGGWAKASLWKIILLSVLNRSPYGKSRHH
jgi:non-heme chloroperoxidase